MEEDVNKDKPTKHWQKMKLTTLLTLKVEFEKRNGEKSIFID